MNNYIYKNKLALLLACIFAGFIASVYFHYVFLVHDSFDPTKVASLNNPLSTFLPSGVARFCDFYGITRDWVEKNQFYGVGFQNVYFPAAYLFVNLFSQVDQYLSLLAYLLIFVTYISICSYYLVFNKHFDSAANKVHGCMIVFITYPFLIAFYTANFEIISFILLSLFFICFLNDKFNLSALFLGLSISMKLFPGVFLIYLLIKKQYFLIFKTVLVVIIASFVALALFKGGVLDDSLFGYITRLIDSQKMHTKFFVTEVGVGYRYGHSILNTASSFLGFRATNLVVEKYAALMFLCFAMISIALYKFTKSNFKLVTAFTAIMLLFPITSQDYKLLYVFIPLTMYLNQSKLIRFEVLYFFSFLLLMVPKDYFFFNNDPYTNTNNLINTLCLLTLLVLSFIPEKLQKDMKST